MADIPAETVVITVEMVAEYLRASADLAHYHEPEQVERDLANAIELVRLHGLCSHRVRDWTNGKTRQSAERKHV